MKLDAATRAALRERFEACFGKNRARLRVALAPGRVNLLGEHTDYSAGFVLPMALDRHVAVVYRPRADAQIRVHSADRNPKHCDADDSFAADARRLNPARNARKKWSNYVRGVAAVLSERGAQLRGVDLLIWADLPEGAGLSSSAALEVAVAHALLDVVGEKCDAQDMAFACQQAEHRFAGVKCGIMDQTVVARAQAGCALLLDCRSIEVRHVPVKLGGWSFALFDTGVRHKLATSAYNKRRMECESAARKLRVDALRDVGLETLRARGSNLNVTEQCRVRHVVTENLRTVQFSHALARGDIEEMGHLLNLSHESLRKDYEVSCRELDVLSSVIRIADELDKGGAGLAGVGARMVGGGFGGCVLALVRPDRFEALVSLVRERYRRLSGLQLGLAMLLQPGDGARVATL